MAINRKSLVDLLESLKPGLSGFRDETAQSTCIGFESGRMMTFNGEIACSRKSPLGEFVGAVKAKELIEELSKWTDEEVQMCEEPGKLVFTSADCKKRTWVRLDKKVKIPINSVEIPSEFKPIVPELLEALGMVQECASKNSDKFIFACVGIYPTYVEAMDGEQLMRYHVPVPIEGFVKIKRGAAKQIANLNMTQIAVGNAWVHFKNPTGLLLSCRRFTDTTDLGISRHIEDTKGSPAKLPQSLIDAARNADVFSDASDDLAQSARIKIELESGSLKLIGEGSCGGYEETLEAEYAGDPIAFYASPQLLAQIMLKSRHCVVSEKRLMIKTSKFVYIVSHRPAKINK